MPSEGECLFCGQCFGQDSLSGHLATHLAGMEPNPQAVALHIQVASGPYFLELLLPDAWTFADLDAILRDIWLECCGHASNFTFPNQPADEAFWEALDRGEAPPIMATPLKEAYAPGREMRYEYDFDTPTELDVTFCGAYTVKFPSGTDWLLLSRNEPLPILCHTCGDAPAVVICPLFHPEGTTFCDDCAEEHTGECEDFRYAALPVVNSPRAGVCAYTGGRIDVERDEIFV